MNKRIQKMVDLGPSAVEPLCVYLKHPDRWARMMAAEVLGTDRLVFGSDYPSFEMARGVANVRASGLDETGIEQILRGNARPLIVRTGAES